MLKWLKKQIVEPPSSQPPSPATTGGHAPAGPDALQQAINRQDQQGGDSDEGTGAGAGAAEGGSAGGGLLGGLVGLVAGVAVAEALLSPDADDNRGAGNDPSARGLDSDGGDGFGNGGFGDGFDGGGGSEG